MKTTRKWRWMVIVTGLLSSFFCGCQAEEKIDIAALIQEGALVIDVRSSSEFSGDHLKGAINIPHNVIARDIVHHEKDTAKPIIVYCRSGARSSAAKKALEGAGYTHVINGGTLPRMRKILSP